MKLMGRSSETLIPARLQLSPTVLSPSEGEAIPEVVWLLSSHNSNGIFSPISRRELLHLPV